MQNHFVTLGSSPVDKAHPTPGPWRVAEGSGTMIIANRVPCIAQTFNEDAEANAALIASAPDLKAENIRLKAINEELLAALEALASTTRTFRNVPPSEQQWTNLDDEALENAFSVIDKARGQE